jgi:hypothetical protein
VGEVVSDDSTFLVWADPGLLTGLAWFDLDDGTFSSWQYDYRDLDKQLRHLVERAGPRFALGYERFIVTSGGARTSSPEHALRAVKVIEDVAALKRVTLLAPQPSSARNLGQVVYLRRLGWYKPGRGHANDAAQHLLAHLLKKHPMPHEIRTKLFPGYTPRDSLAT